MNVQQWKDLQIRLTHHAKSDSALKNPSRVMRHPGFHYIDENDQPIGLVTIINATGNRYSPKELDECLPVLIQQSGRSPSRQKSALGDRDYPSGTLRDIIDALKCIPPRVPGTGTYPEYRNLLWGLTSALAEADAGYSEDLAIELMETHSPEWRDIRQVSQSGGEQIGAGTFWHFAKQCGWRRRVKT